MKYIKVQVNVPPESLEKLREAVKPYIAKSDKYMGAMTWWPVKGAWTTLSGANPYNGKPGIETIADEVILEFRIEESEKNRIVEVIKENHPYEECVISLIPMLEVD